MSTSFAHAVGRAGLKALALGYGLLGAVEANAAPPAARAPLFGPALQAEAPAAAAAAASSVPYQEVQRHSCTANVCIVDFNVVPSGKRLEVTSTSCEFSTSGTASLVTSGFRVLNGAKGFVVVDFMVPALLVTQGTVERVFSANQQTFFFVRAGLRPQGVVAASESASPTSISCKIAGQMVTLQ